MSEIKDTPPSIDDLIDKGEEDDDLFVSVAFCDGVRQPEPEPEPEPVKNNINPIPELPTLQLNMTKDEIPTPSTPSEDMPLHVDVILSSPVTSAPKPLPPISENGDASCVYKEISVLNGFKVGEGMGAYVTYKVDSKSNSPASKKSNFSVQRRFSDFLGLHDKLVEKYLRTGRIIPPAPEKSLVVMTKIKMTNQNENFPPTDERIERRRASLERYLSRLAYHPILGADPDFKEFMESDIELPKAVNTSALSGAGVMRLFNKVGETVNKITYKMEENDRWFEEKIQEIEFLETGIRRLQNSVEALCIMRKDLAMYTGALGKSCAMLSNCEEHTPLSRCLAQLAELQEKVETLTFDQANTDVSHLYELLKDYLSLINAVKVVFHERVKVYQNWQHSLLMLNKKREHKAKLELANKPDKGNIASNEISEWEAKVDRCQEEFNQISKMIKKEMERFEIIRVHDFKAMFIKYMEEQMKHQQQLVKFWEAFLPDAKSIA